MKDEQFKRQLKDTFEQDVPDVLSQIKASPDFIVPEKPQVVSLRRFFTKKMALGMMSIFIVALVLVTLLQQPSTPVVASTITLDVNPSIQITLDENDNVIAVTALNDDGVQVVQKDISYLGMSLDQVLEIIVSRLDELGYIITSDEENNIVLIEVDSTSTTIRDRVEAMVETKLQTEMGKYSSNHWVLNARTIQLTDEQKAQLMDDSRVGMYTRAKLSLIYRITYLDSTYTIDDLLPLSVRELYDIYITVENPDNLPDYSEMPGPGHGRMNGMSYVPNIDLSLI